MAVNPARDNDERLILVSADNHAGADILDYKPYLESSYHDEFDAWARAFSDPWNDIDSASAQSRLVGPASALDTVNWESGKRAQMLEDQGVVAEVIFPNTVPPFYPSGAVSAAAPLNREEYVHRWAGVKAHNRWLADFCKDLPGRRIGIAQVFLSDLDDAIGEVRWAKENGLAGVILPSDHVLALHNLYYPRLDPFWAACAELQMPVHRHAVHSSESADVAGPGAPAIGMIEHRFFVRRGLAHLILAGVFDRFPQLRYVTAEVNHGWAAESVEKLDHLITEAKKPGTPQYMFAKEAAESLALMPSEYLHRNCYFGSFMNSADMAARYQVGVDRMMWAADFPHHEGTWPWTQKALRITFADLPENEIRQMTGQNAIECYDLDEQVLQAAADRVGPTVAEVKTTLPKEDYPSYPDEAICNTFGRPVD